MASMKKGNYANKLVLFAPSSY